MKIQYIVLSLPNHVDTGMAFPAIRIATTDAKLALEVARDVRNQKDVPFISSVFIYRLEEEKIYSMYDFKGDTGEGAKNLVYISHKIGSEMIDWLEHFRGEFREKFCGAVA